jgi:SAM-dependent methyltransferase
MCSSPAGIPRRYRMGVVTDASDRARSFGAQAELYDRLRPEYPPESLDAILPVGARRVADVGAGTGRLTAALLARGLAVIAVEPDAAMREVLVARRPEADVRAGAAEALPLADGEVDAVLFGQSWHWADRERAAGEALRVLAPGGTLAMLWNLHDDRVPWIAELERVIGSDAGITRFPDPPVLPGFAAGRRTDVAWQQTLTAEGLVDLTRTYSAVSTRPRVERDRVLDDVRRLLATTLGASGHDTIDVSYVCTTRAYRRLRGPS